MALSFNLGYQESISVHPTRRQNFAGKVYSNFPNIWQWLIPEYTLYNMYTLRSLHTFSSNLIFSDVIHHTLGLLCTRDFDSQLVCTWRPPRLTGSTFDMINVGASQSQLTFQLLPRAMSVILRDSHTQIWFQILPHWKLTSGMWCSIMTEEQEEIVTLFS